MALLIDRGKAWKQSGSVRRPAAGVVGHRRDIYVASAQVQEDAKDLLRGRARPGIKNWLTFCEWTGEDGVVAAYDNYLGTRPA